MSLWRYHRSFLPAWLPYFCVACGIILFLFWFVFYKDVTIPVSHFSKPFEPMTIIQAQDPSFNAQKAVHDLADMRVQQEDATLVQIIRNYYIELPSKEPYNLENPERMEFYYGFTPYIDEKLNQKDSGFYVEYRALDGEEHSSSLFFEKIRHWNGLLIEPDPIKYKALRKKNRKAFTLNACLHDKPHPEKVSLTRTNDNGEKESYEVQCFPLFSVLLAVNAIQVTVMSLSSSYADDSMNPYDILRPLPLHDLNITFINIRMQHFHKTEMEQFMAERNYELNKRLRTHDPYIFDYSFLEKGNKSFWTGGRIITMVIVGIILYVLANVLAYNLYLKKSKMVESFLVMVHSR